jgi:phosphatidylserine/phosphatidylglycerophosphate/cardiolipin synthase-like enzyme
MTPPPDKLELLTGPGMHTRVILDAVLQAERYVWIATANLKDMHVEMATGYRPILEVFDGLAIRGVTFRIVHCDLPSRPFRNTLERFPRLTSGALELQVCPRSHWKLVLVDGKAAYFGSANLTGAGLGAKKENRRNLEIGAFTRDPGWVLQLSDLFDAFWMGAHCPACAYRKRCPDPILAP